MKHLAIFILVAFAVNPLLLARPVRIEGKQITKSYFNRLYKTSEVYILNTIFIANPKRFMKPKMGEAGIIEFQIQEIHKAKPHPISMYTPSAIVTCYTPKGTFTACMEWWHTHTSYDKKTIRRTTVAVYIGTMKYNGGRIPVLKSIPKVTKGQFKKYLYYLEDGARL